MASKDIIITKVSNGKTFRIKNFDQFMVDLDMPSTTFRMPEQNSTKTEFIKIEGNFKTVTVSWLLVEYGTDLSNGQNIITVDQQFDYLLTTFENISLAGSANTLAIEGASPAFSKTGTVTKILITKDATEPENYRATITFFEGVNIITAED